MSSNGTYTTKDSGEREQFSTGAQRDTRTGKGRYDLISPIATRRLAQVMERGADKYSSRNWEQGMPLSRLVDSAKRHIDQALEGNRDEDHWGHAMFNIQAIMHIEECIDRGLLPEELNDLPCYLPDDHAVTLKDADAIAGDPAVMRGVDTEYTPPEGVTLPSGWEWAGEFRVPVVGDYFAGASNHNPHDVPRECSDEDMVLFEDGDEAMFSGPRHIVRRKGGAA